MRKLVKFDLGRIRWTSIRRMKVGVYTPDCQGNPAVGVFTSKDERLPVHGDIQEEVTFTGYYFKIYGYEAYDNLAKLR